MKLVDYGFSVYVKDSSRKLKVFCGTPSYMAPEIVLCREYVGAPVDIWSLGVLLYAMLCGCFPFSAPSYPELYKKIVKGRYRMPDSFPQSLKELLSRMLCTDPRRRYTISQVLFHPWVMSETMKYNIPDPPHLISLNALDDVNDDVLDSFSRFGLSSKSMIQSIKKREHNHFTTMYYLARSSLGRKKQHREAHRLKGRTNNHKKSSSNSNHEENKSSDGVVITAASHPLIDVYNRYSILFYLLSKLLAL